MCFINTMNGEGCQGRISMLGSVSGFFMMFFFKEKKQLLKITDLTDDDLNRFWEWTEKNILLLYK